MASVHPGVTLTTDQRNAPEVRTYAQTKLAAGYDGTDIGAIEIQPPPGLSIVIDDGTAQRSEVRSITVTFPSAVTFSGGNGNAAAAFELKDLSDNTDVTLHAAVSTNGTGQTVVTLSFTGTETDPISAENGGAPSLQDGVYQLTIFGAAVGGLDLGG